MRPGSRFLLAVLAVVAAGEGAALAFVAFRARRVAAAEGSPVTRGAALAEAMGCFGCHGPGGGRPIANPGSRAGEVPGWPGGTWMMWNRDEADVRAWIVSGRPEGREPDRGALLAMPAYGRFLSERQVDDLVAYVLAVSQFGVPDEPLAAQGRDVAIRSGCLGCHGPEGRGLVRNPGSLTGYVPAWDGDDWTELVKDEQEFRAWVLDGAPPRIAGHPVARRFLERQALRMPAYRGRLDEDEVDALWAFARWVRANPRTGRPE